MVEEVDLVMVEVEALDWVEEGVEEVLGWAAQAVAAGKAGSPFYSSHPHLKHRLSGKPLFRLQPAPPEPKRQHLCHLTKLQSGFHNFLLR